MKLPSSVLIVDDNATNLKLLRAVLEAEGVAIVQAADGVEALSILEHERIDAVITDVLMPRMDGFALCNEIRKSERFKAIPVVVYTSTYSSPADEKTALVSGADKYIIKPAPTPVLLRALNQIETDEQYHRPRSKKPPEESVVLREYNGALIRKLEEKNLDLEQAQGALLRANEKLKFQAEELVKLNTDLERRVRERTRELEATNRELESFSQSLSHDLRNPIHRVQGYAGILKEDCRDKLDPTALGYIDRISLAAGHMNQLVVDMLYLAQVKNIEMRCKQVDLSALAKAITSDIQQAEPGRNVEFVIMPTLSGFCDEGLMRIALDNLFANAWKFTKKRPQARIEFGVELQGSDLAFYVRDNGVGFNMDHAHRLFADFQRLHSSEDYQGTGVGLATVRRVFERHGGRIWAKSVENEGATFYFVLP